MLSMIKRFSILAMLASSYATFGYDGAGGMDGSGYVQHGYPDSYQGNVYYGGGRHYWRGGTGMRCQYINQCHRHRHRIHCQPVRYCQRGW